MNIFRLTLLCAVLLAPLRVPAAAVLLTSDRQLDELLDPDRKVDLSTGRVPRHESLREICATAQRRGDKVLTIAFDEFFRQYRAQAGTERRLTPDMDEYVTRIKTIGDFAAQYGLGIGLSLLSPLELGPAYTKATGESGRWVAYAVGYRDPVSGKFSLPMWQQLAWTNNKGKVPIRLQSVRAFAFRETRIPGAPFKAVARADIVELQGVQSEALDTVKMLPTGALWSGLSPTESRDMYFESRNLRVYGEGAAPVPGNFDRVMVLLEYATPEMDYFSPHAAPFLQELLKKYHDRGINLVSLYSDEMHIQQDWYYFIHHQNGQFNCRYLTPNFSRAYQEAYGQPLEDKDLLYFVYGAPYFQTDAKAVRNVQYVMGSQPEDIHRTFLLRDRYYKLLNHGVTDLFLQAKAYGSRLFGHELEARGHASWAESPTIDLWDTEKLRENPAKYEYTSNYVWGNTVQQASAACYDYFKWSEYLVPTGNDFAEGGWLDRNYYGAAMAASVGVINQHPNAYAAYWGMPEQAKQRKGAINRAFGSTDNTPGLKLTGDVHRDIEVLVLYPLSLVAVEERFGSWMTQYAYANYLTADKLLELGEVTNDGRLRVGAKTYRTLVAIFEPLPAKGLLDLMARFVAKGGTLIWAGPPPLLDGAGFRCTGRWEQLFGVHYPYDRTMGEIAAGREITFVNGFKAVPKQTILTDFLVDRIYPVTAGPEAEVLATSGDKILGTARKAGVGTAYFFGFRPRDDQSASLGYETRTLFELLNAAGSYPPSGRFPGVNDNPTYVSRTTDYLATAFPNGATAIVRHYRTHVENWEGGFSRNPAADAKALAANPMPPDDVALEAMKVNGHEITYRGHLAVTFRTDASRRLLAFEGHGCAGVTLDGTTYTFAAAPLETVTFAPVEGAAEYAAIVTGSGTVTLPIPVAGHTLTVTAPDGKVVTSGAADGGIQITVTPALSGKRLRIVAQ